MAWDFKGLRDLEKDLTKKTAESGLSEGRQLAGALSPAALLRQNYVRQGQNPVCADQSIWLRGHCGSKHENVTEEDSRSRWEHCGEKRTKTTLHSGGRSCQTSPHFQETLLTSPYIVLIHFLRVLAAAIISTPVFCCLPIHFTFSLSAFPSMSPLYNEGADGEPLEREVQWYVDDVCKCPSPQIYIDLSSTPTFMSTTLKVTDHIC